MSELVEFDDLDQLRVLLRSAMELKYELSDDSEILNESPIYAAALNRIRVSLISGLRSSHLAGKAQDEDDWYRLAGHRHRWDTIARRAVSYPNWRELDAVELREWIETLAAPLTVDDETLMAVKVAADGILERD